MSNDKVYISGAMTGIPREQYMSRFREAERLLHEMGYKRTVTPIRVWTCRWPWLYRIVGYRLTLLYDLWLVTRCQKMYKIPGWKDSRGANIESCVGYHFNVWPIARRQREEIDRRMEDFIKKEVI